MTVAISKPHTFVKEEMLKQPQVIKIDDLRLFQLICSVPVVPLGVQFVSL